MWLWNMWVSHGTKMIGFLQGTIAVVSGISGIIPAEQLKYWLLASGLLTFYRGFFNTKQNEGQS